MQDEILKKYPACRSLDFIILKGRKKEEKKHKRLISRISNLSYLFYLLAIRIDKKRFFRIMVFLSMLFLFQFQLGLGNPAGKSFYSPLIAHASWYADGGVWGYRRSITVDHTKVSKTDHVNFPMLVSLTDLDLRSTGNGGDVDNSNGYDIIFTSDDGITRLDYEIEEYAAATGKIVAWVKIPILSCTTDTVIYMYYGNPYAANQQNKSRVWDSNFNMVQHMNEDPSSSAPQMIDSTQYNNNGVSYGNIARTDGKIGGATSFYGGNDYVSIPQIAPSYLTAGAWFYLRSSYTEVTAPSILQSYGAEYGDYGGFRIFQDINSNILFCAVGTGASIATNSGASSPVSLNEWHHIDCSYDGVSIKLYLDGVLEKSASVVGTMRRPFTAYNFIGRGKSWSGDEYKGSWNGILDEVRVSSVARSADWIATEYNNQSDPDHFYLLGDVSNNDAYYFVITANSSQRAGNPQPVAVTAMDAQGNIATAYEGEKFFTFSGASILGSHIPTCSDKNGEDVPFGNSTTLIFAHGRATCNLVLYKAEEATVAFTDGRWKGSFKVDVLPQPFNGFNINAPASVKTGETFTMTAAPRDYYGNSVSNSIGETFVSTSRGNISGAFAPTVLFNDYIGTDGLSYTYRRTITITNNDTQNLVSFQVKFIMDTASLISGGKMQNDCDDLRFVEVNGDNIPYWIESGCNSSSTEVWIKTDLDAAATKTIYAYYGNAAADSESAADKVFIFYDDFENGLGKWEGTNAAIYNENGDNILRLMGESANYASTVVLPDYQNVIVESKFKFNHFGFVGPRLVQDFNPMQTMIESYSDAVNNDWHLTWLGTSAGTEIVRIDPSWYLNREYLSKFISTNSLQRWEVGESILSGTYARAATISGGRLKYMTWDYGNDVYIYWVKIRQYITIEPTVEIKKEQGAAGFYSGEFTVSGILQDVYATISIQNGNIISTADMFVEASDHMSHFRIEGAGSQVAGTSQTITITAIGKSGMPYTGYEGDHSLIFSGADSIGAYTPCCNNVSLGTAVLIKFTNGVAVCNLTLYEAKNIILTASEGEYDSIGGSLSIEVLPAELAGFDISMSDMVVAETAFSLSIGLHDKYGNAVHNISNDVSIFADKGIVTPSVIAAQEFSATGRYIGSIAVSQIYADIGVSLVFSSGGIIQGEDIVVSGVDHLERLRLSAQDQIAGAAQMITITAIGASGKIYFPYSGNKSLIFSGVSGINGYYPVVNDIPFGTGVPLTFLDGTATAAMKLYKTGTFDISVAESSYSAVQSVNVFPSSLENFDVVAPVSAVCGKSFAVKLTARDVYGNILSDIPDAVNIKSNKGTVNPSVIPSHYFSDGEYSGDFIVSGIYIDADVAITFQSRNAVKEHIVSIESVDQIDHFIITGLASQEAGKAQNITISAILNSGNIDVSYSGNRSVIFSGASAVNGYAPAVNEIPFGEATIIDFTNGSANASMKLYKTGAVLIDVGGDSHNSGGYSLSVDVSPAAPNSFAVSAPSSVDERAPFALTISARDAYGNSIVQLSEDILVSVDYGVISPGYISAASFAANGLYEGEFVISDIFENKNITVSFRSGEAVSVKNIIVIKRDIPHHFKLEGVGTQIAGESMPVAVSMVDASGEVEAGYQGSHNLIFSGALSANGNIPAVNGTAFEAPVSLLFVRGVAVCNLVVYKSGETMINVSDGTYDNKGYPLAFTVLSASVANFDINIPDSAVSGENFSMILSGKDLYANATSNVQEDISVSVDRGMVSPAIISKSLFRNSNLYRGNIAISEITADEYVTLSITSGIISQSSRILITAKKNVLDTRETFILPAKPDMRDVHIILSEGRLRLDNIPSGAIEISVSASADFSDSSWEKIKKAEDLLNDYINNPMIYAKLRGKKGGVSDVIRYSREGPIFVDDALKDGDIVKTEDDPDVYILKLINGKQFRRLILSPKVFNSYQHLKWGNIKTIPSSRMAEFMISNLVQVRGDKEVYELFPDGDAGKKRVFGMAHSYDSDAVYEINRIDRDNYKTVP